MNIYTHVCVFHACMRVRVYMCTDVRIHGRVCPYASVCAYAFDRCMMYMYECMEAQCALHTHTRTIVLPTFSGLRSLDLDKEVLNAKFRTDWLSTWASTPVSSCPSALKQIKECNHV